MTRTVLKSTRRRRLVGLHWVSLGTFDSVLMLACSIPAHPRLRLTRMTGHIARSRQSKSRMLSVASPENGSYMRLVCCACAVGLFESAPSANVITLTHSRVKPATDINLTWHLTDTLCLKLLRSRMRDRVATAGARVPESLACCGKHGMSNSFNR